MPTTAAGDQRRRRRERSDRRRTARSPSIQGRHCVRQDRPRRHRHRSRAVLDDRDDDPPEAAREWPMVAHARWYSGWAPAPRQARAGPALARADARDHRRADRHVDRARGSPGWTNAWTAPIRARMDMMSTGVRTPVGVRVVAGDAGAAGRAGRGRAGGRAQRARHAQRGLRVAGRRDAAGVRARRGGAGAPAGRPGRARAIADLL